MFIFIRNNYCIIYINILYALKGIINKTIYKYMMYLVYNVTLFFVLTFKLV